MKASVKLFIATLMWFVACAPAWADLVGPNLGGPGGLESTIPFVPGIDPWRPPTVNITGNADASPWIKRFQGPIPDEPNPLPQNTGVGILERINLGQAGVDGLEWKQWVEQIITPGWEWQSGSVRIDGKADQTFAGVLSDPDGDGLNDFITFSLPSLQVNQGHFIAIEKVILCADPAGCPNRAGTIVTVLEWPVVPLPPTLSLIAGGFVAMFALGWRRR